MTQDQEALRTLLQAAERYATIALNKIAPEQRTAIAAAIVRGCVVELRISPMSRHGVQLVLVGGTQELELGHVESKVQ